jgi:hypothetical protein
VIYHDGIPRASSAFISGKDFSREKAQRAEDANPSNADEECHRKRKKKVNEEGKKAGKPDSRLSR